MIGFNLFAYCTNNPVNRTDESGNASLPNWAKIAIGIGIIAGAAILTVATGGAAAGVAGYVAAGVLKGALVGGAIGAAGGAVNGAVGNRIKTGSWSGSGHAAINGAADGFMKGTITGAISGGARSVGKIANATKAWNGTTKYTPYQDMVRHYNKHVINEGQKAVAKNIVKYTNDAVKFYNSNSSAGRMLRTGVMKISGAPGGIYTTSKKILSFWYC